MKKRFVVKFIDGKYFTHDLVTNRTIAGGKETQNEAQKKVYDWNNYYETALIPGGSFSVSYIDGVSTETKPR